MLGDLGSVQKKGRALTTEGMKCPRVLGSASFFLDPWHKEAAPTSTAALGELALPEVFRPVPFLGQYQQTVVGKVRQGTWRIKNQPCGRSLMYIHCV